MEDDWLVIAVEEGRRQSLEITNIQTGKRDNWFSEYFSLRRSATPTIKLPEIGLDD
jgi:hypothetical protein